MGMNPDLQAVITRWNRTGSVHTVSQRSYVIRDTHLRKITHIKKAHTQGDAVRHPPDFLIQVRHRAAATGAEGTAAGAGGTTVGALAHPVGPNRVHWPARIATAGGAGRRTAARVRRYVTHALQRAGGLGKQRQAEEFILHIMLPLKQQIKELDRLRV